MQSRAWRPTLRSQLSSPSVRSPQCRQACRPPAPPTSRSHQRPPDARVRASASSRTPARPPGTTFASLEVGGLSGLAYDRAADLLYAVVDDATRPPAARLLRFRWHPPARTRARRLAARSPTSAARCPSPAPTSRGSPAATDGGAVRQLRGRRRRKDRALGRRLRRQRPPAPAAAAARGVPPRRRSRHLAQRGLRGAHPRPRRRQPLRRHRGAAAPGPAAAARRARRASASCAGTSAPPRARASGSTRSTRRTRAPVGTEKFGVAGLVDLLPFSASGSASGCSPSSARTSTASGFAVKLFEASLAGADERHRH